MDILSYTVHAIKGTISSSTPREQRQEFQAFLVQLKESQECSTVLCRILTTSHFENISATDTESIHILSLSLFHDWIKLWWDKIDGPRQLSIREICSGLLAQSSSIPHTSNYSSKLAAILADVVERQFPQQWPSFIADVKMIWLEGPAFKQEIILKALHFVLVDCTDSDFNAQLSSKRSQEIITGFHEAQEDILDISFQYFAFNLQTAFESQDSALIPCQVNEAKRCLVLLLQLLRSMASIVPNAALLRANRNFAFLLIKSWALDGLQVESMTTFEAIVKQSIEFDDLSELLKLMYSTEKRIVVPSDPSDAISFINSYMKSLSLLLSVNVDNLFHLNAKMQGRAEELLGDLLMCLKHPQRRIAIDVCPDLIKVLKNSSSVNLQCMDAVAKALLQCYMEKSQKPNFIVDDEFDEEEWYELEFDDRDDWNTFFSSIQNQTLNLAHLFCEKFPATMVSFFAERIQTIIQRESELVAKWPTLSPTQGKGAFLELQAQTNGLQQIFYSSINTIVSTIKAQYPAQISHCLVIADLLWQWKPQGVFLFRQRLKFLANCFPLFKEIPGPLLQMLEFLFSIINGPTKERLAPEVEARAAVCADENVLRSESKEIAASSLSSCIQKCPEAFASEQVLMQLLTTVTNICRGNAHSVPVQDLMREALVSLSLQTKHPQLCKDVLDIAFLESLQKVSNIVKEVFVSPEVILQAIITPVNETNTEEIKNKDPTQMTTVFLHRANRLRMLLQNFISSMAKVDSDAIASVAQRVWASSGIISSQELQTIFPLAYYWTQMLHLVTPALNALQKIWSPRVFKLLSSNPAYDSVKRSVYGISIIDGCKRCKLPNPLENNSNAAEVKAESVLKDVLHGLFSVFFKVFGVAAKQSVLLPLILQGELNVDSIVLNSVYLEHNHYSFFIKYFAEHLTLNAIPQSRAYMLNMQQFFVESVLKRISISWAENSSATNEEEQQLDLLYRGCFIFSTQFFSADQQQIIRAALISEATQCSVDMLSNALALKGELALKADVDAKNSLSSQLAAQRKAFLWSFYFGTAADSSTLLRTTKQLLLSLFQVPDGGTCRQALAIITLILKHSEKENHLVSFVTKDCFRAVVNVLLQAASWSQGLEWDLIEYLLESIRVHELIDEAMQPKQEAKSKSGKGSMNSWSGPSKGGDCFKVLAEFRVANEGELKNLHDQLQKNNSVKKKKAQRDILKDFISTIMQRLHGSESLQAKGSAMVKADAKVADLATNARGKPQKPKPSAVSNPSIGDLFDDDF